MTFPELTILICTYNRIKEIAATVNALAENLIYPRDKLHVIVCDDSSPGNYAEEVKALMVWGKLNPASLHIVTTPENGGWGVNVNNGLNNLSTEYCYFTEDDYVLREELDLRIGVALLETRPNVGMVRYRGTAGSHIIYHQFETDISAYVPDYQEGVGLLGRLTYLQIDNGSHTLWVYSHGPHLKRISFHQYYGLYPEGLKLGQTEESYCHIVKDKMRQGDAPAITILPRYIPLFYDHIGESYQFSEFDT